MKKIIYALLYSTPALILGGISLSSIPRAIMDFGNPYIGFWGGVTKLMVPMVFILLSYFYLLYGFKQEYINKYTNWSIFSWYAAPAILIAIVATINFFSKPVDAESQAFGVMYLAGYVLFATGLSVIVAHITGLIKGELKPKILNIIFVVSAIFLAINMGITIYRQF